MPNFRYIVVDKRGERQEGTVETISQQEAYQLLRGREVNVMTIQPVKSRWKRIKLSEINLTPSRIDPSLKVVFFRSLSTLINAGIPLIEGLEILKLHFKDKHFPGGIEDISNFTKSGQSFSEALRRHPKIFPRLVVSLIRAAEMGGGLGKILNEIAHYMEREENIRKKLKSATIYPKFILTFFTLVLAGVVFGLLPQFESIYESFDAQLPGSTVVILAISDFVKEHLIIGIAIIVGVLMGLEVFKESSNGRMYLDRHIFLLPLAGSLIRTTVMTRVTQTLSVLLKSGVPLIDALKISGETADNVYVNRVIDEIVEGISHGKSFASQLTLHPNLFPVMDSGMIDVGEKSGALDAMLSKIAEFNNQDFKARFDQLTKTIEPIILGGLGIVICIIVLALYLPIFRLTDAIH